MQNRKEVAYLSYLMDYFGLGLGALVNAKMNERIEHFKQIFYFVKICVKLMISQINEAENITFPNQILIHGPKEGPRSY